ncbi:MAG: hypothetical protein U1B79_00615 [Candidatus Pacearchaeota archaeon]|nr:hypothetical protein [Candidatus Pacearchaeota archaeon]
MRKIVSAEEEARKKKRNQIILGVFLAFIMVASTIGFALQSGTGNSPTNDISGNEVEYNGFKFVNQNGLWVLGNFVFRYTPQQVPDINTESGIKLASNYQGKPAYVYSEDDGAEIEIAVNLGQLAQRVQKACPAGTMCYGDLPVKTCSDNFIIIKESNTSRITQENNCVFIEGQKEELAGIADQFLFKMLGIR